jgi:hypothetical protein
MPYETIWLVIHGKLLKTRVGEQLIARSCRPQKMTIRPPEYNPGGGMTIT